MICAATPTHVILGMGRKKDLKQLGQRGPGRRRVGKQGVPELPAVLRQECNENGGGKVPKKSVGGHIRQRARKRAEKVAILTALKQKRKEQRGVELRGGEGSHLDPLSETDGNPFSGSDSHLSWLKPVKKRRLGKEKEGEGEGRRRRKKGQVMDNSARGNDREDEEEEEEERSRSFKIAF